MREDVRGNRWLRVVHLLRDVNEIFTMFELHGPERVAQRVEVHPVQVELLFAFLFILDVNGWQELPVMEILWIDRPAGRRLEDQSLFVFALR
jgi:hypothetical protein